MVNKVALQNISVLFACKTSQGLIFYSLDVIYHHKIKEKMDLSSIQFYECRRNFFETNKLLSPSTSLVLASTRKIFESPLVILIRAFCSFLKHSSLVLHFRCRLFEVCSRSDQVHAGGKFGNIKGLTPKWRIFNRNLKNITHEFWHNKSPSSQPVYESICEATWLNWFDIWNTIRVLARPAVQRKKLQLQFKVCSNSLLAGIHAFVWAR